MAKKKKKSPKNRIQVSLRSVVIFSLICAVAIIITLNDVLKIEGIPTWGEISIAIKNAGSGSDVTLSTARGDVEVHFIDVGQGESILIKTPDKNVLIDAGENDQGSVVMDYLKANSVKSIDLLIGTHPHADHIGGMDYIIKNIPIGKIVMPKLSDSLIPTTRTYTDVLSSIADKGLKISPATVGTKYDLGAGAVLTIIGPNAQFKELNDMSVMCRLDFGDSSFIFTGDGEKSAEAEVLSNKINVEADVLNLGHHGSSTSTSSKFLKAVNPKIAVASCGIDNKYGHPHEEIISAIYDYGDLYRTDLMGNIKITTDGKEIIIIPQNGETQKIAA